MAQSIIKYACPYCSEDFESRSTLRDHLEKEHPPNSESEPVWGREVYPPPTGVAFIDSDVMKCVGCGLCAEACSMKHFGVINKDFSRIHVRKFLLPLPKAIIVTCSQCQAEERPCEEACPVTPPAIHFDDKTLHMVVDEETCTGCLLCRDACAVDLAADPRATTIACVAEDLARHPGIDAVISQAPLWRITPQNLGF